VVATLYRFGLKRGVGLETRSAFFARLPLEAQVGLSPSALCCVRQALAAAWLETAEGWAEERSTEDEVRELMGAVAETFVARLRLVCLALPTGYGLRDEVAADQPSPTWKAVGEARLKALDSAPWAAPGPRP